MAPATVRRAPYKDFLQPALHRRFSTTATIILAIAYVEALFLGTYTSWFWSWFPIGPTGLRTLWLFAAGLIILVLRIAQYHVGLRTSNSALQTFVQYAPSPKTVQTLFDYTLASWLFSQVYLWSVPEDAGLRWITYFNGDRPRLNEKPLFLTVNFIVLGIRQAISHLSQDVDGLRLGTARPKKSDAPSASGAAGNGANGDTGAHLKKFVERAPYIVNSSVLISLSTVVFSIIAYMTVVRALAWTLALSFFRWFFTLPRYNMLPLTYPFSMYLLARCFLSSLMLLLMWQAGNIAFSIFMVKEPIKNGKPLTSESKDPNGSLLNGMKSKKLPIKCFAVWELAFIARDHADRRKAIFEDIDRKDGPMWSQVYSICLGIIQEIESSIDNYGKTPAPPTAAAAPTTDEPSKREFPPLRNTEIATPPGKSFRGQMEKAIVQVATDPDQKPWISPKVSRAKGELTHKLRAVKQQLSGPEKVDNPYQNSVRGFLSSPVGSPFRQEFSRRLTAAVFGAPYGEPSLYINAADALSQLAVRSLEEDKYGNVQRDVAQVIRTITRVTRKLAEFRDGFQFHWTDVDKQRRSEEVDQVLEALRESLSNLKLSFEPYSRDLRLTLTDLRLAQEAIGVPVAETVVPLETSSSRPEIEQAR